MATPSPNPPTNSPPSSVTPLRSPSSSSSPPQALTAAPNPSAAASQIQDQPQPLSPSSASGPSTEDAEAKQIAEWLKEMRGYLVVLATLVASVTYSAGVNVPGGFWQDDSPDNTTNRHTAGNPVLADKSPIRYIIFFFSNASAFATSMVAIALLLQPSYFHSKSRLQFLLKTLLGSLITLVVAFCAGGTRNTGDIVGMVFMLVFGSLWLLWALKEI